MNQNTLKKNLTANVMFVDMNSFFASCEQQVNYWLRGRPVAVCVYTGKYGCIISPSIEAKKQKIKTGMRLNDAMQLCPELVPLETHPQRYREYHKKLITVFKKYSDDVVPKSIDEAVINFKTYNLVYANLEKVANKIKHDIKSQVGDWLQCSIGIAPNSFLAKLASDLKKPDGLVTITPANIDTVLAQLSLTDLPGIAKGMSARLIAVGITTPLQLRHARPSEIKNACKSVVGIYWHYRLNFSEIDLQHNPYKSMQAMRMVSIKQRKSPAILHELLFNLCMRLEARLVKQSLVCRSISLTIRYDDESSYKENINTDTYLQDGAAIHEYILRRIKKAEQSGSGSIINNTVIAMGVYVSDFTNDENVQFSLFDNNYKKQLLRKTVYRIKGKYGADSLIKAKEISDETILKDAIGFGSVKDMYDFNEFPENE